MLSAATQARLNLAADPEKGLPDASRVERPEGHNPLKLAATRSRAETGQSSGIPVGKSQQAPPVASPTLWHRRSDMALKLAAILSGSLLLLFAILHLEFRWGMVWTVPETMDEGHFASAVMAWGVGLLGLSIILEVGGVVAMLVARLKKEPARRERSRWECHFGCPVAKIGLFAVLPFVVSARLSLPHNDWPKALAASVFPLSVVTSALLWAAAWRLLARRSHTPT